MNTRHSRKYLLVATLLIAELCYAQTIKSHPKNATTMQSQTPAIQSNKEVIRTLYEQALNKRNFHALQDYIAEDYVGVNGKKGAAGFKEPLAALISAFPDIQWNVEELISEGDQVAVKWRWQGTHTGPFQHIPASSKTILNAGMAVYQLRQGKVIKSQIQTDRLGFLQQLEILPADLSALSNSNVGQEQVCFIDKFFVPAAAKAAFYERMRINRGFIKKLPGFIEDTVYEYIDEKGNLNCLTVATWESNKAVEEAKAAVQAEYKKQGFDPAEMVTRLGITLDRAIYHQTLE